MSEGRRPSRWGQRFDNAAQFVRDTLWLVGWGARRLGLAARDNPAPVNLRGCLGCVGSLVVMLFAAVLWRRRRR